MNTDALEALNTFLMSERAPDNGLQLSDLDGFLTALAVSPAPASIADYLPTIWNGDEPDFDDEDEKEWVLETIQARYDEIATTVRNGPRELTPLFWVGPSGQEIVDDWAAGFLDAVRLSPDAWRPVFESDDAFLAILPLLIAELDAEGLQKMNISGEVQRETLQQLPELLPACIENMRETLAQHAGAATNDSAPPTKH
jgi:uncharacterized protein